MSRVPRAAVERLRSWSQRLPDDSVARSAARAGLHSARIGQSTLRDLQVAWGRSGIRTAPPSYAAWRRSVALPTDERPGDSRLLVVVLDPAGQVTGPAEVPGTAHPRVDVVVARDAAAVQAALAGPGHVSFLRPGDVFHPGGVVALLEELDRDPLLDVVVWDDDVVGDGSRRDPRVRPSWSPDLLLTTDYVGRAFTVRRSVLLAAGGWPATAPVSSDASVWDVLLRVWPDGERAGRVAQVLSGVGSRPAPGPEAAALVTAHCARQGIPATAVAGPDGVRLAWDLPAWPAVRVVVPTRHDEAHLATIRRGLAATGYPGAVALTVVDNGERTPGGERFYADWAAEADVTVHWWTEQPFNYSAVNNAGARDGAEDVLVFLNDDIELVDPGWLTELVGWTQVPGTGLVGLHLHEADGTVQHAGVVVGIQGLADHLFSGLRPGADTLLGPVRWTRDVLAVTGACTAVRRSVFTELGGFDERFELTGSDVALGLSAAVAGLRTVCSGAAHAVHRESSTRGSHIPTGDFYASFWRYNTWIMGGDPYWSPSLSTVSGVPQWRRPHEPSQRERAGRHIHRQLEVFRQRSDAQESRLLAEACRITEDQVATIAAGHAATGGPRPVRSVNWFIPDIDSPFYGGINTALRIADLLTREHGVRHRFVVWGSPPDHYVRSALAAAYPRLADSEVVFYADDADIEAVPAADVDIATLWVTAFAVAKHRATARKFYLVQDYEPMFYPAGTQFALAEESYRLGLYGLANTDNLARVYRDEYAGRAWSFTPAVDPTVFHPHGRPERRPDDPVTVFVYARPGHWRNCWELAAPALELLKRRLGNRVRIVTAGSWALESAEARDLIVRGLIDYRATGDLYRGVDVGLALTVSRHPSYLPLELMASGAAVVAFDNPWGHWLLEDGVNSLLARRTIDGVAGQLERMCVDRELREKLAAAGTARLTGQHSDWDAALGGIYGYLCDPEAHLAPPT
ncbi:rhamnosyltransferase WsaF family glycosyltransferase [Modestobacter versicolor]|uniref:rhamnosyltransferase WsaF family glycosyltransferase n=1 Tax=Modestobacter versicolor TaxID=429133 RepID=UPI0034DF6C32